MTAVITNIWLNAIIVIILTFASYFFLSHLNATNKYKIFLSILSVILIFLLAGLFGFSRWQLHKKRHAFRLIRPKIVYVRDLADFEADKYLVNIIIQL